MNPSLVHWLVCPSCRGSLRLHSDKTHERDGRIDVIEGGLSCVPCSLRFAIADGVPWMATAPKGDVDEQEKRRTASSFGHLWAQSPANSAVPEAYHFEKMAAALRLAAPSGLVLDAGCGDGIDLAKRAADPSVTVIGAELSAGGARTTARRIARLPNAHVVQADLARLPFRDCTFQFVYSYGVLHHMPKPLDGLTELGRVAMRAAPIAIYLYEDFSDRSALWRGCLKTANMPRTITTRMPHGALFMLCRIGSPVVFLTLTLPHRLLHRLGIWRSLADRLPFRHGKGPFSMTGDLYDRFSAPVEFRYSPASAERLVRDAGLMMTRIANERGWMVLAERAS